MVTYPDDWKGIELGDFLHISRGASPRPIEFFLTANANGVNWIKIGDAPRYGKFIESTDEKITPEGAVHSVSVFEGDFILSNSMSFGRPYILNIPGCIHDGWLRLSDYQEEANRDFLYYVLSSDAVQRQYTALAAGSGVQNLNKNVVRKVVIHLPSLPEQRAIAEALTAFDDYIADLAALIEKKKAIRDGALEDLVSGRTRLDGVKCQWVQKELWQVASYRKERVVTEKRFYVSTENIKQGFAGIVPYAGVDYVPGTLFSSGDILMANIRPYLKKIWYADFDGGCSADVLVIQGNDAISSKLLYYLLANEQFINYVMTGGVKGIKMPRGDKAYIMRYPLLLPEGREEQESIATAITAMDSEIKSLEAERDKMIEVREGAMDDLLTGRVRLSV